MAENRGQHIMFHQMVDMHLYIFSLHLPESPVVKQMLWIKYKMLLIKYQMLCTSMDSAGDEARPRDALLEDENALGIRITPLCLVN